MRISDWSSDVCSSDLGQEDGDFRQVTDDLLDVAADVADFGELRRLDLDEGRLRQLGESAGDPGLADAGRADPQDVLRQNLVAAIPREVLDRKSVGTGKWGAVRVDSGVVRRMTKKRSHTK